MKKSLFFGMAALVMAGLSSCSNDDLLKDSGKVLENDQSFFVNINIATADNITRAGGGEEGPYGPEGWNPTDEPNFDPGNKDLMENEVKTIFLIFYDENGDRVYTTQVRRDNNQTSIPGRNPSENSLYKGVVQVDVKHGSLKPTHVMCFINPITSQSFEMNPDFASLDALQKTTRPRIIDDNGYFAMSKSVYYGPDRSEDGYNDSWKDDVTKYKKIVATPIGDGQLFNTYDEAKAAVDADTKHDADNIVDIYVERYAAKVNFSIDKTTDLEIDDTDNEGQSRKIKLSFVPEYWAVNAYEDQTYICKSFLGSDLTNDMAYETMNSALGGTWYWNSVQHHRCYWAQTPAYYKQAYPRVADDILDLRANYTNRDENFALGYYSYNEMVANSQTPQVISRKARNLQDDNEEDDGYPIYARENTVSGKALQDAAKNPLASAKAAVASVVLVGHYEVNGNKIEDNQTFYIMGNAVNGYDFFYNDEELIPYMVNTAVHFTDEAGDEFFNYGLENYGFNNESYAEYFTIEHPEYSVRSWGKDANDELVIDSRYVTVQLDKSKLTADGTMPIYFMDGDKRTQVTKDNIDYVNQQMLYQAGTVQGFQGGKAYFNIPIQHLGYYRSDNKNYEDGKTANDKNFDWEQVKSGDFGLVRNHTYTIKVSDIKGLGNGIPNPNDPIVPPTDPEEYYIGARIIVLNWAIVPTQTVVL